MRPARSCPGAGCADGQPASPPDCLFLAVILVSLLAGLGADHPPLFTLLGAGAPSHHPRLHADLMAVPPAGRPHGRQRRHPDPRGYQDPHLVMGSPVLVNGVLDPLLIFGPGPSPIGHSAEAAIATSLSWLMAMLVSLLPAAQAGKTDLAPLPAHSCSPTGAPCCMWQCRPPLPTCSIPWPTPILMVIFAGLGTEVVAAYGAASRVEALLLIVMMALSSDPSGDCGSRESPAPGKAALLLCMRFAHCCSQLGVYMLTWLLAPLNVADLS